MLICSYEILLFSFTDYIWYSFTALVLVVITYDIPGLFHLAAPAGWLATLSWVFGEVRRAVCFGFGTWSVWMWNTSTGLRTGACMFLIGLFPLFVGLLRAFYSSPVENSIKKVTAWIGIVNTDGGVLEAWIRIGLAVGLCICGIVSAVRAPASRRVRVAVFFALSLTTLIPGAIANVTLTAGSRLRSLAEIGGEGFFAALLFFLSMEMPVPEEYFYRKADAESEDAGALIGTEGIASLQGYADEDYEDGVGFKS